MLNTYRAFGIPSGDPTIDNEPDPVADSLARWRQQQIQPQDPSFWSDLDSNPDSGAGSPPSSPFLQNGPSAPRALTNQGSYKPDFLKAVALGQLGPDVTATVVNHMQRIAAGAGGAPSSQAQPLGDTAELGPTAPTPAMAAAGGASADPQTSATQDTADSSSPSIDEIDVSAMTNPQQLPPTAMPSALAPTDKGIDFIKGKETSPKQPLKDPYLDTSGNWTIGFGHKLGQGGPQPQVHWDDATVQDNLQNDVSTAANAVRSLVNVPLTADQFDALTSLVFNVGQGNFAKSQVLANLNAGDYAGAAREMLTFDHSSHKIVPDLTDRRRQEAQMFAGDAIPLPPNRPPDKS